MLLSADQLVFDVFWLDRCVVFSAQVLCVAMLLSCAQNGSISLSLSLSLSVLFLAMIYLICLVHCKPWLMIML